MYNLIVIALLSDHYKGGGSSGGDWQRRGP